MYLRGIEVLFRKEYVKKGFIEKESGLYYSEMFKRRRKQDHADLVEFYKEDVVGWIKKPGSLWKKLRNYF